jgi:hypothetical protein
MFTAVNIAVLVPRKDKVEHEQFTGTDHPAGNRRHRLQLPGRALDRRKPEQYTIARIMLGVLMT